MVKFTLTRTIGTASFTAGVLAEETTGFKCHTLERRDPDSGGGRKYMYALPLGEYKLRAQMEGLQWQLCVSKQGYFCNAKLTSRETPREADCGCICVGAEVDYASGTIARGAEVTAALSDLIERLRMDGRLSLMPKPCEIVLEVKKSDAYFYDEEAGRINGVEEEDEDANWDFT